jgi:hypothetical protein
MALQSSGAISISQIKAELGNSSNSLRTLSAAAGKSAPDSMSEFYGYSAYTPPYFTYNSSDWPYVLNYEGGSGFQSDPIYIGVYNSNAGFRAYDIWDLQFNDAPAWLQYATSINVTLAYMYSDEGFEHTIWFEQYGYWSQNQISFTTSDAFPATKRFYIPVPNNPTTRPFSLFAASHQKDTEFAGDYNINYAFYVSP